MKFAGALQGQRSRRGIFITTSRFSREAVDYAGGIGSSIVLIDGKQLTRYMIDSGIGVTPVETFSMSRLDEDYFEAG